MIATIERKFLGTINDKDFFDPTEYKMTQRIMSVLEEHLKKEIDRYDVVESLQAYIYHSINENKSSVATVEGCLRAFAKSSVNVSDFIYRMKPTREYESFTASVK